MPIRHCQKCGLKVLIDESQTTANPFYCQRCGAAAKGPEVRIAPPKRDTAPAEAVAGPGPGATKGGGPVKILCPYCKASFSGRLPSKPAKGACPVCQKELVLLPDGKIRPAATFDLTKWQKEQELVNYSGDAGVAEQARAVHRALEGAGVEPLPEPEPAPLVDPLPEPPPEPPPEPEASDLKAIVDPTIRVDNEPAPVIVSAPEPSIVAPPRLSEDPLGGLGGGETMLDMGRPSELDELVRAAAPGRPMKDGDEPKAATAKRAPEPLPREEEVKTVKQNPSPPPDPKTAVTKPHVDPVTAAAVRGRPHPVKIAIGALLLLLPLIAGGVCELVKKNAKINELLDKVGAIATQGLRKIHVELTKERPPEPAPDKPPEKTPEATATPAPTTEPTDAEAKSALERQMTSVWQDIRSSERAIKATDEKALIEREQAKLQQNRKRFDELQASYRKRFGAEFRPQDE